MCKQLVAGASAPAVELVAAQRSAQAPQSDGVGSTDRGQHDVDRGLGVDRVRLPHRHVEGHLQQGEQGTHRHLVPDGDLGGWHRHGHAGGHQNPAQGAGASLPPDDHGHVGPRHTGEQVRLSQLCRDQRGLLRGRAQEVHIGASALPDVCELAVGCAADRADAPGHAVGDRAQCLGLPV